MGGFNFSEILQNFSNMSLLYVVKEKYNSQWFEDCLKPLSFDFLISRCFKKCSI